MTCEVYFPLIQDYLDQSLDPQDRKILEEHIRYCSVCQKCLDQIRTLKQLLRNKYQLPPAPEALLQSTCKLLQQHRKKSAVRIPKWGFLLAMILIVFPIGFFQWFWRNPLLSLNQKFIRQHHQLMASPTSWKMSPSCVEEAERWFQQQTSWPVKVPCLKNIGFQMSQSGTCRFLEEPVGLLCYKNENQCLTLFVVQDSTLMRYTFDRWYVTYQQGTCLEEGCDNYRVLYWQKKNLVYVLVLERCLEEKIPNIRQNILQQIF